MNERAKTPAGQRDTSLRSSPSQSSGGTFVTAAIVSMEMPRRARALRKRAPKVSLSDMACASDQQVRRREGTGCSSSPRRPDPQNRLRNQNNESGGSIERHARSRLRTEAGVETIIPGEPPPHEDPNDRTRLARFLPCL